MSGCAVAISSDPLLCPILVNVETRSQARAALLDCGNTALVLVPPPILIASALFGGILATSERPIVLLCSFCCDHGGLQCYNRYPYPIPRFWDWP